ncbi:MAG TPA: hypothetical protein VJ302_28935, partial [Blastocatellia bacterium]|nr:hypothetical protein [Blastocatellia bacterium]
ICALGPALGQVRRPEGVTISAFTNGQLAGMSSIVIGDTNNNRVQGSRFPIGTWVLLGGPGTGIGQFTRPGKIR